MNQAELDQLDENLVAANKLLFRAGKLSPVPSMMEAAVKAYQHTAKALELVRGNLSQYMMFDSEPEAQQPPLPDVIITRTVDEDGVIEEMTAEDTEAVKGAIRRIRQERASA